VAEDVQDSCGAGGGSIPETLCREATHRRSKRNDQQMLRYTAEWRILMVCQ